MSTLRTLSLLGTAFGGIIAVKVSTQCRPPANSHEAGLLAFYEVPATFSLGGAPEQRSIGAVDVGAAATPVRSPNAALTHPQYCYQYTTNNTKLASAFARPRIVIATRVTFTPSWWAPSWCSERCLHALEHHDE
jgi:hypothetical protein